MSIKTEWVSYGDQSGYLAVPEHAAPPLPGVVVIQEIGGVSDHIEDVTRRIAAAGYVALAPDLFAVNGKRPVPLSRERVNGAMAFMRQLPPNAWGDPAVRDTGLAKLPENDRRLIGESLGQLLSFLAPARLEGVVGQLRSAVRYLRSERPDTRQQRVGCVGFCMGGGLSALLACEEPELAACAIYYGNSPSAEKAAKIRCPVIAFYGEKDERVNAGVPGFAEAMQKGGKSFEHHTYPGAFHAFFNDDGPRYNVAAARDSFARLLAFFVKTLTE
ncbi:MAG TPA: dienelactone hydrolase family protein [Spirochaetia bacterium]|nr:dienelactone hydrolase family protein [Spirochaetia bacterium]